MFVNRHKYKLLPLLACVFILTFLSQCHNSGVETEPVIDADEGLSGGKDGTVFDQTANAFGNSINSLNTSEIDRFVIGNSFNRNNWVTAPSSTSARDGLGPFFNATSCSSCHFLDGKGAPTSADGLITQALLFRLSIPGASEHGGPVHDPNYGEQFNPRGIISVVPEGDVSVVYQEQSGTYPDGTAYSLRKPAYVFSNLKYGMLDGTMISPRIATQMSGVGLLEAIPEAAILSREDPDDKNKDGISGRANQVWDFSLNKKVLGRFGWKANQPSVKQQTAGAFVGDIGITSSVFPTEDLTTFQREKYGNLPNGGTPEVVDDIFDDVVFYIRTLAVPAARNFEDDQVVQGKRLFLKANCSGCHIPKMTTGISGGEAYLSNQTIRPYTDLLLHDMGEGLADGRPDFEATGNEWRTAPLWGIGLVKTVNKHTNFLHDGRARNMEEAILWHGGEAESAKKVFMSYSKTERDALLRFLDSL